MVSVQGDASRGNVGPIVPPVNETWKAVGNRVREARVGTGHKNTKTLAALVRLPRFGKDTISAIERGERELFPHEAEELARVLHRPVEFFLEGPAGDDPMDAIAMELAHIRERLDGLEKVRAEAFQVLAARVRAIEALAQRILENQGLLLDATGAKEPDAGDDVEQAIAPDDDAVSAQIAQRGEPSSSGRVQARLGNPSPRPARASRGRQR